MRELLAKWLFRTSRHHSSFRSLHLSLNLQPLIRKFSKLWVSCSRRSGPVSCNITGLGEPIYREIQQTVSVLHWASQFSNRVVDEIIFEDSEVDDRMCFNVFHLSVPTRFGYLLLGFIAEYLVFCGVPYFSSGVEHLFRPKDFESLGFSNSSCDGHFIHDRERNVIRCN